MAARILKPGSGSQDLEARMWNPASGKQDVAARILVARIWKPRSGSENDEKALSFIEKVRCVRKIDSRMRFVDIRLENVAIVATRVVEGPYRCS